MADAIYVTQFGTSDQAFQRKEIQLDSTPEGYVTISVDTFGLNYADVMSRTGLYNDAPPLPFVPGYEVVGHIKEIGKSVTDFKEGDRVLAFTRFGGYAQEVQADVRAIQKLPDSISDEVGVALATQYSTAYYMAIRAGNIQKGEKVLVHAAAGGVGTALVQLAKWKECEIIGTAGSTEKLAYLKELGCHHPINYRTSDYEQEVIKILGEKQLDVAFNPIGGDTFKKDQRLLNSGARHFIFGVSTWSGKKGTLLDKIKLAWDFGLLHPLGFLMKSQGLIGVNMLRIADNKPQIIGETLQACIDLYTQRIIRPHVGGVYPIAELNKAHDLLENRQTTGKVVVKW